MWYGIFNWLFIDKTISPALNLTFCAKSNPKFWVIENGKHKTIKRLDEIIEENIQGLRLGKEFLNMALKA